MSYATPANVKSMFRDFSDNTNAAISDAELQEFLNDTDALIDAKIGTMYTLPLTEATNPKSWAILKRIEIFLVAEIVDSILNNYAEADKKPNWGKKGEALLNELIPMPKNNCTQCEPTTKLPDAEYLGNNVQRNRIKLSATTGSIFKKGENNW